VNELKVCEIFYSLQGEGVKIGKPAVFLRLSGCNLRCRYCDTKYAWHEGEVRSFEAIKKELEAYKCRYLVITGGEPLLQANELKGLLKYLDSKWEYSLETNATLWDESLIEMLSFVTLSPKMPSAEVDGIKFEVLDRFFSLAPSKVEVKIVIDNEEDWYALDELLAKYSSIGNEIPLVIQPQSGQKKGLYPERLKAHCDVFLSKAEKWRRPNVRFLPQFQKILWWGERGV